MIEDAAMVGSIAFLAGLGVLYLGIALADLFNTIDVGWVRVGPLFIPVIYTDKVTGGAGGAAVGGFLILMRPKYRDDKPLHAHEVEHIKQAWLLLLVIHSLLYRFMWSYRLWAEVEAYRVQLNASPESERERLRLIYAGFIATRYKLPISTNEALEMLR